MPNSMLAILPVPNGPVYSGAAPISSRYPFLESGPRGPAMAGLLIALPPPKWGQNRPGPITFWAVGR